MPQIAWKWPDISNLYTMLDCVSPLLPIIPPLLSRLFAICIPTVPIHISISLGKQQFSENHENIKCLNTLSIFDISYGMPEERTIYLWHSCILLALSEPSQLSHFCSILWPTVTHTNAIRSCFKCTRISVCATAWFDILFVCAFWLLFISGSQWRGSG